MTDLAWYWLRPVQVNGEPYVLHAFAGRELYPPRIAVGAPTLYAAACMRLRFLPPARAPREGLPLLERCPDCAVQMFQAHADGITVFAPLRRDELKRPPEPRPTDRLTPYVEPSDGASPDHRSPDIPSTVERALRSVAYPQGSYALYQLVCGYADAGAGTLDLVALVEGWSRARHHDGPPLGLDTITQVLDCADALERGGFLLRTEDPGGERWTALLKGAKRQIPGSQRRMWGETT
ncbi:hypothetical protein [Kutzneria buriramensis]|uniref:Uncharacterized protein n=1 Tax=Kutzneria buriramensis TaxID=1045776 RepID=A0A3E0HP44_9PSEU|nr:hypothetical protein [Kutzneria buriramensis]REH48292.1 hypothetical protein BCF44_105150 [Kutzneria buriramensis]